MGSLRLALRYLAFNKWKAAIVIVCVALTVYTPLVVHTLVAQFEADWRARAEATPLVAGAAGSRFDLALHALYFQGQPPREITFADFDAMRKTRFGEPIPIFARFTARKFPIVGTSLEYFSHRGLRVTDGHSLSRLGECILGAGVARELGLGPGDTLLSDPENLFDIAGAYPLKMHIAGVFAPTGTPDDMAIFADVKTTHVIAGFAHGHNDLSTAPADVVLDRKDGNIVANAALVQFTEVTPENISTFHFHAEHSELPLTAIAIFPRDAKEAALLRGRYENDKTIQVLVPEKVVDEILAMVLRARQLLDASVALVACSTALFLALTIVLSARLRKNEMETMYQIGCARHTMFALQAVEIGLLLAGGLLLAALLAGITLALVPSSSVLGLIQ